MAATSVFQRVRTGSKIGAQYDQEGNLIKVETREDEEQNVKLAEILELLLAAGYFRARIKGLTPFDKVVGGLTWCITTCNFDIDVDLLFQENSTIGQKIALTEKIVSVLPKMKCPHRLEPHQIQGLDFIHIFPVVQWLVKKAIETREEMGDYIRSYSISQFQKTHAFPEDEEFASKKDRAISTVVNVCEVYAPQRRYKRQEDAGELLDEESRVHSTLLEFGRRYGFSKQSKSGTAVEQKQASAQGTQGAPPGMTQVSEEEDLQAAEELRIKALMTGMAAMATEEGKLSASTVGHIVGLQSEEIKQIATEYAEKAERSVEDRPERFGPVQQHRRQLASLNKQITQKTKELEELQSKQQEVRSACEDAKIKLAEATSQTEKLEKELSSLEDIESQADSVLLDKLRALVAMNENLKHQEQTFRSHCREEMTRLQQNIEELKLESGDDGDDKKEMNMLIDQQYTADREKLQKIRLLMARRNREIAILQRKIDEVPSRAELTQYQKRFIELYSQVSATHKETKQFFTLYNTLDDKKVYLEKEVNLLNSIHDHFQQAMASSGGKEQFLRQMEQIVEGIKQSRIKMEKKRQENKMRRDQLNDEYLELLDKQRLYFKTVKDFKEECRKNEMLLSKLRAKGAS
ncbi:coiled-coil domain-containing protein 93 [Danio rerio]|uniref:Coiled-coil domain-containing protein 93 n=1 Tax=Danio rerio TaxID=7955 RepID=Q1RLV7_DANRE|nr:coiled-coil domain-containing protein 93 [Danio rerio]AAI15270.1 Coiled-coil domain containing 93 [Danio rerio]|eukprot:NP_001035414.1 coiled-coil domain-containing protein 93 [Danio rerio]